MNTLANISNSWCGGFNMGHIGGYSIFNILILIGIIVLIYFLVRNIFNGRNNKGNSTDNALQILKNRLARGEIDTEEYNKRKDSLKNK